MRGSREGIFINIWRYKIGVKHTRVMAVCSGKGGVGKTTLVANVGLALAKFGKDVTIVDANFTTPDLSFHFGTPMGTPTLHHVLAGEVDLKYALHVHPSGLKVIPASLSLADAGKARRHGFDKVVERLGGDFVLVDSQAGLGPDVVSVIQASTEVLVVTNPEWPAITDALKTILVAKGQGKRITGVVLNRITNEKLEPGLNGIEGVLDASIIGMIPEDRVVRASIATRNPAVISEPHSEAAIAFRKLAADLAGIRYRPPGPFTRKMKRLVSRLLG